MRRSGLGGLFMLGAVGIACAGAVGLPVTTRADLASFQQPTLDRWMYPFNFSPGTRTIASTFGSVGTPGFDNRDAQFLVGFNTATLVPTGQGAANYRITSVRLTATDSGGVFAYDPTYDAFATSLDPALDTDAGRPVEIHGAGFRNGYTGLGFGANDNLPPAFEERSPFAPAEGERNAFALGFDAAGNPRDVSRNVDEGFESDPWAIGTVAGLAPGAVVPADANLVFALDLTNPSILGYFQNALNDGALGLVITSMHEVEQGSTVGTPRFYTKENPLQDVASGTLVAPRLEVEYTIVPEPAGVALCAAAAGMTLLRRRRPRHD
jgi:hypothetical protein